MSGTNFNSNEKSASKTLVLVAIIEGTPLVQRYFFRDRYYSYYYHHKADFINPFIFYFFLQNLEQRFSKAGLEYVIKLMSEIFPAKLGLFEDEGA